MTDTTLSPTLVPRPGWRDLLLLAGISLAGVVISVAFLGLGVLSLPSLALLATIAILIVRYRPTWLVVMAPALIFIPGKRAILAHEVALVLLIYLVVVHGLRHRARWLVELDAVERANLLFLLYGMLTFYWVQDGRMYLHGVRRLGVGIGAFWVTYRLARFVPRRIFEYGLIATIVMLGGETLLIFAQRTGFGSHEVDRAQATHLGWGTSNYIATMLLVLGPPVLDIAFRSHQRLRRGLAWLASALNGLLQVLIASRAATVLYFGGLLAQIMRGRIRHRRLAALAVVAILAGVAASPFGQRIISRFYSPRELGAMVVRIWYAREGWRRTIEGFPLGIGLNQGFVQSDHLATMGTHDYWLDVSSELGIPGLVLWVAFLVVLWRRLRLVARTPGWEHEGLALLVAFWLSQLHTLVEPTFQGPHYQFVFFWLFGGYLGYHAIALQSAREAHVPPGPLGEPREISPPPESRGAPPTPAPPRT